jgi:hypothetical protein
MITPAPEIIKRSIGNEAADALGRWFQDILETNAVSRDEHSQILSRFEVLETRFGVLERDVSELRQDLKDFRREVNQRFDNMYDRIGSMMKWTVGTIALFGTLITTLLTIGQFVK